jgi:hypothetical protein
LRVRPLPRAAGRPSWLALVIVAALTFAIGFGAGYGLGAHSIASPLAAGAPTATTGASTAGQSQVPQAVSLPTYLEPVGPSSSASLTGQLALDGPCLYVVDGASVRWLPIWPAGEAYGVSNGVLSGSAGAFAVGDLVVLAGAEYPGPEVGSLHLDTPIDHACQGGNDWLVTSVRSSVQSGAP